MSELKKYELVLDDKKEFFGKTLSEPTEEQVMNEPKKCPVCGSMSNEEFGIIRATLFVNYGKKLKLSEDDTTIKMLIAVLKHLTSEIASARQEAGK